VGIDG